MSELLESLHDGVLTLTLNRPERMNALTDSLTHRLLASLRNAEADSEVRVVVITGAGRAFCAGGDVKAMASGEEVKPTSLESQAADLRIVMESSRLLREMPKPTIAVARGAVAGAGLSLFLACDIQIASDSVKMTSAFAKVALSGDFGGTYFMTKLLGARARYHALLSPVVKADEALRLGMVSEVVPDAELEARGLAVARTLADGPTLTLGHIKANLNFAEQIGTLAQSLDQEALRHIRCLLTEDHKEAALAFAEKRPAKFAGR